MHRTLHVVSNYYNYYYIERLNFKFHIPLIYFQKFSTTTRQEQVAKLNPSQVIELAYLCALLEEDTHIGEVTFSQMFECIQVFLKNVVKVVPFESIAYAVANGNHKTSVKCAKLLLSQSVKIPYSQLMANGLLAAGHRFKTGFPARLMESARVMASKRLNPKLDTYSIYMETLDSNNILVHAKPLIPVSPFYSEPVMVNMKKFQSCKTPPDMQLSEQLLGLKTYVMLSSGLESDSELISGLNIELVYATNAEEYTTFLTSPIDILVIGRKELKNLVERTHVYKSHLLNKKMLETVNGIRNNELDTCTSLLGGFMDQESVGIALGKSKDTINFRLHAPASVGVWTLFSLEYSKIKHILAQCHGEQLLVKVMDHVKGISGVNPDDNDVEYNPYAAKLQFIAQGMTKYVGYSLERQLVELCHEREINAATSLRELNGKWFHFFKGNMFSLVDIYCRPLIARWIKWALMIHDLREELAKYTAVGVVGLVNSGKSKLVSTLFGIQVRVMNTLL